MQEKGGKVGRICTELENTVGMKDEMLKGWKDGWVGIVCLSPKFGPEIGMQKGAAKGSGKIQ